MAAVAPALWAFPCSIVSCGIPAATARPYLRTILFDTDCRRADDALIAVPRQWVRCAASHSSPSRSLRGLRPGSAHTDRGDAAHGWSRQCSGQNVPPPSTRRGGKGKTRLARSLSMPSFLKDSGASLVSLTVLIWVLAPHPTLPAACRCAEVYFCAIAGAFLAQNTAIGSALTGPVSAMVVSVVLAQLDLSGSKTMAALAGGTNVAATASISMRRLQRAGIAMATPLLLLSCDFGAAFSKDSRRLLWAFTLGACGVLVGAAIGCAALRSWLASACRSGPVAAGVAAAIAAKCIGSGINFVAVAEALRVPGDLVALALTADNVLALFYFPLASSLIPPAPTFSQPDSNLADAQPQQLEKTLASGLTIEQEDVQSSSKVSKWRNTVLSTSIATSIACATGAVFPIGEALIASSILTVVVATCFTASRKWQGEWTAMADRGQGIAEPLVYIYSGSVGFAMGRITQQMMSSCVPLLIYCVILYAVHLLVALSSQRLFKFQPEEVMVASAASIGGPTIACALALSKGFKELAQRALLVGTFGNAIGTLTGICSWRLLKLLF